MPLFATVLPKSGTHLIRQLLRDMGLRPSRDRLQAERSALSGGGPDEAKAAAARVGEAIRALPKGRFLLDHFVFHEDLARTLKETGSPALVLVRDPRDFLVSLSHYALAKPSPGTARLAARAADAAELQLLLYERQSAAKPSVFERYLSGFDRWVRERGVVALRFEELVGAAGGGDADRQLAAGRAIAALAQVRLADVEIAELMRAAYGPGSATFRRGVTRAWTSEMDPALAERIWARHGELIERWGFERNGALRPVAGTTGG